jgi:molybdenum-dependent DNA-binding transcriptional regulator ModE
LAIPRSCALRVTPTFRAAIIVSTLDFSCMSASMVSPEDRHASIRPAAASLPKRRAKVHNSTMFDWSDLRHLIAVSRHGSTLAAAKVLGVNQSTVHRRLAELEKHIGLTMVRHHPTGYRLTEVGEAMIDHVLGVETAVRALELKIQALKNDLTGVIRLTCPEPTVSRIVASGLLERFYNRYPRLTVEFVTSDRYLDIAAGEADVGRALIG